jgi:hypothetical protein
MAQESFIVVVDEASRSKIEDVAQSLKKQGLDVRQTLRSVGAIIGTGESSIANSLANVEGVQVVEKDKAVQLPPMKDDTSQ